MTMTWLVFAAGTIVSFFPLYALAGRAVRSSGVPPSPRAASIDFIDLLRHEALQRAEAALSELEEELDRASRNGASAERLVGPAMQTRLRELAQMLDELFTGNTRTICLRNIERITNAAPAARADAVRKRDEILDALRTSMVSSKRHGRAIGLRGAACRAGGERDAVHAGAVAGNACAKA